MKRLLNPSYFVALLPLWPTLAYINRNKYAPSADIDWLFFLWLGWLALFAAVTGLGFLITRQRLASRVLLSLSTMLCASQFYYDFKRYLFEKQIESFNLHNPEAMSYFVAFLLGVFVLSAIAWVVATRDSLTKFVGIFAVTLAAQPSYSLFKDHGSLELDFVKAMLVESKSTVIQSTSHLDSAPNIYFFVFDAYLRSDLLTRYFDFDNQIFEDELEALGFKIARRSFSNFPTTRYSINYTFNPSLSVLVDSPENREDLLKTLQNIDSFVGDDRFEVEQDFQSLGYDFTMMTLQGADAVACRPKCIVTKPPASFSQIQYMKRFPIYDLVKRYYRESLNHIISRMPNDNRYALDHFPEQVKSPFLLISHALMPHPPYALNSQCLSNAYDGNLTEDGFIDLNYAYDYPTEELRALYLDQTQCANIQMIELANRITKMDPDALILFTSDHGWKTDYAKNLPQGEIDKRRLATAMRVANFMALRAPERCLDYFSEEFTLVESFPLLKACVLQQKPEPVSDKIFRLSGSHSNLTLEETTEVVRSVR